MIYVLCFQCFLAGAALVWTFGDKIGSLRDFKNGWIRSTVQITPQIVVAGLMNLEEMSQQIRKSADEIRNKSHLDSFGDGFEFRKELDEICERTVSNLDAIRRKEQS